MTDTVESETGSDFTQLMSGDPHLEEAIAKQAELLDLDDEDELVHRKRAVGMHRNRFFGQLRSAAIIILLAAAAPGFWRIVFTSLGGEGIAVRNLTGFEKQIADGLMSANSIIQVSVIYLFALLPIFAVIGLILWMVWYRRERKYEWQVSEALADAREPADSAKGFMLIFRLYARTKRRAIFTMLYATVGLWWMISCFWALFEGGATSLSMRGVAFGLPFIAVVIGTLSLVCYYLAYDISRMFVPGKVLVRKTLIMSMLATTSQTDYTQARAAAHELEKNLMDDRPWWFYSYRKAPKQNFT